MSDLTNIKAAVLNRFFFGELVTRDFANHILNGSISWNGEEEEVSFVTYLWASIVQHLNVKIAVSKTSDVRSSVTSGQAEIGLSLVREGWKSNFLFEPIFLKEYQLMIAHESGPRLADLSGVYAPSVWLTICIVALLMLLALAASLKFARAKVDFVEIAVTIMGLLCYQGNLALSAAEGRLVLIIGLFFGYLIMVSFSSQLVSQLTVGYYPALPTAAEVLSSYRIYAADSEILQMANSAKEAHWRAVRLLDDVTSICYQRDGVAFLVKSDLDLSRVPCEVTFLPETFFKQHWGIMMQKKPATIIIRKIIRKLLEGGVVDRFSLIANKKYQRSSTLPSKTRRTQEVSIAFTFPIIAILIAGMFASIVAFVFEILFPCKKPKQARKRKKKTQAQRMPYLIIAKEKNP